MVQPPAALRRVGVLWSTENRNKSVGDLIREAPQGQLNLAYPTGIRAEALSLWLRGPLPGRGVKHRGRPGSCLQPVAALPPVYTGVPPRKADFGSPKMRPGLIAG